MALIVQKYGGTSVGSIDSIKKVASRIKAEREKGNQVVAVISAMGVKPISSSLLRVNFPSPPRNVS